MLPKRKWLFLSFGIFFSLLLYQFAESKWTDGWKWTDASRWLEIKLLNFFWCGLMRITNFWAKRLTFKIGRMQNCKFWGLNLVQKIYFNCIQNTSNILPSKSKPQSMPQKRPSNISGRKIEENIFVSCDLNLHRNPHSPTVIKISIYLSIVYFFECCIAMPKYIYISERCRGVE